MMLFSEWLEGKPYAYSAHFDDRVLDLAIIHWIEAMGEHNWIPIHKVKVICRKCKAPGFRHALPLDRCICGGKVRLKKGESLYGP